MSVFCGLALPPPPSPPASPLCAATLFNAASWSGYGYLVANDPMIWGPNSLGLVAALVQMGLFAKCVPACCSVHACALGFVCSGGVHMSVGSP